MLNSGTVEIRKINLNLNKSDKFLLINRKLYISITKMARYKYFLKQYYLLQKLFAIQIIKNEEGGMKIWLNGA